MARAVLTAVCILAFLACAVADGGNLGSILVRGKKDPANCGALGQACCIRSKNARCNAAGLDCIPDNGGNPRCRVCGTQDQWPCGGKKCDGGLTLATVGEIRVCVAAPRQVPSDASAPVAGTDAKDKAKKKEKKDGELGKKLLAGVCSANKDCRGNESCVSGICQPCGGQGQPCCTEGKAKCTSYGGGSPELLCEFDVRASANKCGVRQGDQLLV